MKHQVSVESTFFSQISHQNMSKYIIPDSFSVYTYRVLYRIQTIFYKLICVSRIAGNNLTQLESKMIGGTYADELADKFKVYPVYISKLGIPFLTGIRITLGHVLTVATHLDEIQARLRDYKVHYKNPKNPGQKLDRIGVEAVKKHPNYIEGEEFTPFNVGFIQVSFSIYNQH